MIEQFVSRLQNPRRAGNGYSARCPSHDDKKNSLSVDQTDGKILVKCHAGCETELILGALGLKMADLFASNGNGRPHDPVIEHYVYTDENGSPLFRVCRTASKDFKAQPYKGGAFVWEKLGDTRRVPYNLPAVIQSKAVIILEGEKDVETLRKLKLVATTNPFGAGKWDDSYNDFFRDKRVAVIGDNDEPGRMHAWRVASSIVSVAETVRLVQLADVPEKGDVTDYLAKHTRDDLLKIITETKQLTAEDVEQREKSNGHTDTEQINNDETGYPILVKVSDVQPKKLEWLWHSRIPLGKVTVLDGDPALGKSLISIELAALLSTGRPMPNAATADFHEPAGAVFLSAEDDPEDTIQPRLALVGADLSRVVLLQAVRREDGLSMPTIADLSAITQAVKLVGAKLVVIDPLMAYLPAETNSYRDQDVRRSLAPLAALAAELNVSILVIRHLNKTANNNPIYRGGGSIGIIGAARSGLVVAKDPDDDSRCILSVAKSNLAKLPASLAYEIRSSPAEIPWINWLGATQHTASSLLHDQADTTEDRSSVREAEEFLQEFLKTGPRKVPDILKGARAAGIAEKTLRRAKTSTGVKARKAAMDDGWIWELPKMANPAEDGQTEDL